MRPSTRRSPRARLDHTGGCPWLLQACGLPTAGPNIILTASTRTYRSFGGPPSLVDHAPYWSQHWHGVPDTLPAFTVANRCPAGAPAARRNSAVVAPVTARVSRPEPA